MEADGAAQSQEREAHTGARDEGSDEDSESSGSEEHEENGDSRSSGDEDAGGSGDEDSDFEVEAGDDGNGGRGNVHNVAVETRLGYGGWPSGCGLGAGWMAWGGRDAWYGSPT